MLKINSLIKKVNNLVISRIELIGSFFNRFKNSIIFKKNKKIKLRKIDNRITIGLGILVILVLSYFLLPTFYDKNLVKIKLKKEISKKYNLDIKFEEEINYRLFPKPHFFVKNSTIKYYESNLAKSEYLKIYISIKNFFLFDKLKIKDLVFKKTQFNIDINKIKFFQEVFDTNKSEYNLNFKDSILFYKNKNDDVIFFTSIDDLNFSYNKEFQSQLDSSYEIFNIPFNLKIINDSDNKKIITKLDSHKIRLNINNDFNYHEEDPNGLLEIEIINKSKLFKYIISNNSLNFNSNDNSFKGNLDFRPFYFKSDLNFNQLDIKNIFKSNSILLDLLYSKILNNQNLNAHININFDKIKGVNYLKNVNLKTYFEEGRIIIKNSNLDWNNSLLINLDEIQLIDEKNELLFVGGITFEFMDIENFYSHYQIKKNYRKKINKIRLDFLFNLDENLIQIDNLKIDGTSTKSVDNYLNEFNSKKINIFNKVILRNSMKEFFAVYHEG